MFRVNDEGGNLVFEFSHDRIRDRANKIIGLIRNGVVCDKDGTPTQCRIVGTNIMGPNLMTGKEDVDLNVEGTNIMDTANGWVMAVVVGAKDQAEIMLGAAALWQFSWSVA